MEYMGKGEIYTPSRPGLQQAIGCAAINRIAVPQFIERLCTARSAQSALRLRRVMSALKVNTATTTLISIPTNSSRAYEKDITQIIMTHRLVSWGVLVFASQVFNVEANSKFVLSLAN